MKQSPGERRARCHAFLRRLRAKGRSNMYGAVPYLMNAFQLDRDTAFSIVCEWVDAQDASERAETARSRTSERHPGRTAPSHPSRRRRGRTTS